MPGYDEQEGEARASGRPWRVDDISKARWAAKKLAEAGRRRDEVKRQAAREIAEVEAWRDAELKKFEGAYRTMEAYLREYLMEQVQNSGTDSKGDPNVKSIDLGVAVLRSAKGWGKAVGQDSEEAAEFVAELATGCQKPEERELLEAMVETRRRLRWGDLRKAKLDGKPLVEAAGGHAFLLGVQMPGITIEGAGGRTYHVELPADDDLPL